MLDRREFFAVSGAGLISAATSPLWGQDKQELAWHNVEDWGVEGKGFTDTERYFDRLPKRAKATVRPAVWNLSRHSAGMMVRFKTNATKISAHYKLLSPSLAMAHMPATGVSGLDLYAEDGAGKMRWLSVNRPASQEINTQLISNIIPGDRVFSMYLPLYNGTEFLKIGVPKEATFEPIAPRKENSLVFYGTSITHGACASRPGMPHPAILGRRLNRPVYNFGFSGNGTMETAVGAFLTELNADAFILDCLPNMVEKQVQERTVPIVEQIRKAKPDAAIVLVEDRTYANAPFVLAKQKRHAGSRGALKSGYDQLIKAGVKNLHYIPGDLLLGDDRDDTTDGSHPNDLGFFRHAEAFEPILRKALGEV